MTRGWNGWSAEYIREFAGEHDRRVMVLAPHADDETLGCGGLLAEVQCPTAVVVVARPQPPRMTELHAALRALRVNVQYLLDGVDGYLDRDARSFTITLDAVVDDFRPTELYIPAPGAHQDHVATYEAGLRSARRSMRPDRWWVRNLFAYQVAVYDLAPWPAPLHWTVAQPLSREAVEAKAAAMRCYASQGVPAPHAGSPVSIIDQARGTGAAWGMEYAELFAPLRQVRSLG